MNSVHACRDDDMKSSLLSLPSVSQGVLQRDDVMGIGVVPRLEAVAACRIVLAFQCRQRHAVRTPNKCSLLLPHMLIASAPPLVHTTLQQRKKLNTQTTV
jgi:hypothetical protein